jgi:hypothetical protein
MDRVTIPGSLDVTLTWNYSTAHPQVRRLIAESSAQQWNPDGLDWRGGGDEQPPAIATEYGRAAFEAAPFAAGRPDLWRRFRREQQAWMVGQFLHGEQSAMVTCARLTETLPDIVTKAYAAVQAAEEARHVLVFDRYTRERVEVPYPVSPAFATLLGQLLRDSRWDILALGMHVMVESVALAAFRLASTSFHDPLIRRITHFAARDEARHVAFGTLLLDGVYGGLTLAERAEREEFVLEAAELLSRHHLMTEVWQRLEVDAQLGAHYERTTEMMVTYRATLFARVIRTLTRLGLMTPRVQQGLATIGVMRTPERDRCLDDPAQPRA